MILIAIALFIGVLYWDIKSDYKKWSLNKPVDHLKEWKLRGLLLIPSAILFSIPDFSVWKLIFAILMQGAWWWEFFDGFYNKLRGFSWRFNGSIDGDDSVLDKFLHKLTDKQETFLKWGLILLLTILYIIV